MKTTTKRATRRLAASLAIVLALATGSAWAAQNKWTGAVDSDWSNTDNWNQGYAPAADKNDWVMFETSNLAGNSNLTVVLNAAYVNGGGVQCTLVGSESEPLTFRAQDDNPAYGVQFGTANDTYFGHYSGGNTYVKLHSGTYSTGNGRKLFVGAQSRTGNGHLTIETSASMDVGTDCEFSYSSDIVNRGLLKIQSMTYKNGTATSTFTFDGGTIEAKAAATLIMDNSYIAVNVTSNGGTIDAAGYAVSIERPIADASGETGAMTFKGGGSVSLKYANTYTGGTTIEADTTLKLNTTAKTSLVANSIAVTIPASGVADGSTVLEITDGGTFSQAEVDAISISDSRYVLRLADNGAKVVIEDTQAGEYVWNDGASGASWKTAGKWSKNGFPGNWYDSTVAVFATDGDAVQVDSAVTAASIEFRGNATVNGSATLTVPTVTVAEGKVASIVGPTADVLEKKGAGTLTLGSSRTDATTLTEGTLVANAPIGTLVFGTDYPVTFDYRGQTLSTIPASAVGGGDVTLKNGTFGSSINVDMNSGSLRVEGDSTVVNCNEFNVGPSDGSSSASYVQIGGMFNAGWHVRDRCGDFIMTNVTITASKNYEVGSSAAATRGRMILSGGSASIVGNFNVFNGELEIMNETVEVAGSVQMGHNGNSGLITLKSGGTLTTKVIQKYGTPASATVLFDGGTLKANAENANGLVRNDAILSIQTSANGGTIDAAGYAVTVHREIENKSGESGAMTYKGGGSVTLTEDPTYTGMTTIEVGTRLAVPSAIAGNKLTFTIPTGLAKGVYPVIAITGGGVFADDVLSAVTKPGDENATFRLSYDKKTIVCFYGFEAEGDVYIGATDGDLSTASNWLSGTVPTGGTGDAQIFCASATTLTVGDTFAPAKLIIPDGSAVVTIGSGTLYVDEVVNRQLLVVGAGATVVIGDQLTLAKGESLCDQNNGTLVVSNLLLKAESGDRYVTTNQTASSSGVFKFDTVTNSMTDNWLYLADKNSVATYEFYIGAGGLNFLNASGTAGYCLGRNITGNSTTIRPWYSNFTIADRGNGNRSLMLTRNVTFCTDDENGDGRTITIDAKTRGQNSPVITVSGKGTLQVNGTCDNSAQPTVTVTGSATLAFGADASLGTGAITLGAGTTLALTATSNEFTPLTNEVTLPTGESEKATIRIDGARLKSGPQTILSNVAAGATANVELDMDSPALAGRKGSLKVMEDSEDPTKNNLVLTIQPDGLMIIIW